MAFKPRPVLTESEQIIQQFEADGLVKVRVTDVFDYLCACFENQVDLSLAHVSDK